MASQGSTFQWTNTRNQYYGTIVCNLLMLGHGMVIGWVAPAAFRLCTSDTPLVTGPLTNEQLSWLGSINCVGALCGAFSYGYFTTVIGSKLVVLLSAIPIVSFWILIAFGDLYEYLLIARFIGGFAGGGIQVTIMLYVSEIANDDIRGGLGSVSLFLRNIGTLIAYILGATVEYEQIPYICVLIPIAFTIVFATLPNTPQYYVRKGQMKKAEDSVKYYKGYESKSRMEDDALYKEFEKLKMMAIEQEAGETVKFSDFFNKAALRGIFIGIALSVFTQLTATFTIISYAVITFAKTGTTFDPYLASIILAVCLIVGSSTTTLLADRLGRRVLNIVSLMGSAIGLFATSLFHYLHLNGYDLSAFGWIPVCSLSFVIFISSAGILPLTNICSVENLPPKVRTMGMAVISFSISLAAFISVKLYPILLNSLDLHGTMMIYAVGCVVGIFFVIFILKDTNGTSLDSVGTDKKAKSESVHA